MAKLFELRRDLRNRLSVLNISDKPNNQHAIVIAVKLPTEIFAKKDIV